MALASIVRGAAVAAPRAAPFGINIGFISSDDNTVAWVEGQSQCDNVILAPTGANFCNRPFSLNGETFTAQGCGGPFWIQNADGSVFAYCTDFSEESKCGVTTQYHCI
ncbi:hypothetical protein DFH09DRAFT_929576 [Mycena vulgaris]|nr:hypothetical protein DFH09DRAFT_945256 [Mycena vulgaris]KAJ6499463.1 hypothetical protein DFH09DRAFT_945245 [Mycena vulgaris]KAJ6540895.1 hypothetical protein DFH09DRAFT_929633 [Mycena vulgaris]KAJ6540896.1 hypothetical protein DFH09DRAFT_929576 [Mycena vulgaris]